MENNEKVSQKQWLRLTIVLIAAFLLVIAVSWFLSNSKSEYKPPKATVSTLKVASSLNHLDPETMWMEREQQDLKNQAKQSSALTEQLKLLRTEKETQQQQSQANENAIKAMQDKITLLETDLAKNQRSKNHNTNIDSNDFMRIDTLPINTHQSTEQQAIKTVNNFVPSGTFIKGVVLEGADPSAGISAQSNPVPMLIRFIDNGQLPNHFHAHLKDCVAVASAKGDISAERGDVRVERVSCVASNGRVFEAKVNATVAGPDGKNGIRGNPLWRNDKITTRAGMAGFLSGVGDAFQQSSMMQYGSGFGVMQTVSSGKVLQYGLGGGAKGAADRLADYWVRVADQYQPVIQLTAGTVVDVIVEEGFYLDDGKQHDNFESRHPEKLPSYPDERVGASMLNLPVDNNNPLTLSPEDIEKMKMQNAHIADE